MRCVNAVFASSAAKTAASFVLEGLDLSMSVNEGCSTHGNGPIYIGYCPYGPLHSAAILVAMQVWSPGVTEA